MPAASQWRSSASYDYIDDLTASELAWEWLRRNEAYGRDYEAFAVPGADENASGTLIRDRWGVRFPSRSIARLARRRGVLVAVGGHIVGPPDGAARPSDR
ncbi:transcriptional regulator domain-containing protein [Labrys okinawensis]|uniref:transcriptional regulator domain-containing protein n=1 Tax=Labrys okinawensis TaxID=346911 RepID=UPI0039BC8AD4